MSAETTVRDSEDKFEGFEGILADNRPSDYDYALLSAHVYGGNELKAGDSLSGDRNWKIYKVESGEYGYFGAIYINDETKQVVLAHRGTDSVKALLECLWGVWLQKISPQKEAIFLLLKEAISIVKDIKNGKQGYHLSFTGHSLGAFLAELSVFYAHNSFNFPNVNAVTFESPGSKESIEELQPNREKIKLEKLDIVGYVSYPNFINTWNRHVGTLYQIEPDLNQVKPSVLRYIGTGYTEKSHAMQGIVQLFKQANNHILSSRHYMSDWPLNPNACESVNVLNPMNIIRGSEKSVFFKHVKLIDGRYILKNDIESLFNEDEQQKLKREFSLSYEAHYKRYSALGGMNILPLRHFSRELQKFLIAFHGYRFNIAPHENACEQLAERWKKLDIPDDITSYLLNYKIKKDSSGLITLELDIHRLKGADVRSFRHKLSSWLESNGLSIVDLLTLPSIASKDLPQPVYQSLESRVELIAAIVAPGAEVKKDGQFDDMTVGGILIDIPEDTDEQNIGYLERLSKTVLSKTSKITAYGIAPDAKIGGSLRMTGVKIGVVDLKISRQQADSRGRDNQSHRCQKR